MREPIKTLDEARKVYPAIWVITKHPSDYPNSYVARPHYGPFPDELACVCDTLEDARAVCNEHGAGLMMLPHPSDDPVIVETWI